MTFTHVRFALYLMLVCSSIAEAKVCSSASLSGTYGFLHDGTDSTGTPYTAAVSQVTFDATTGTFSGETTASHDGTIATESLSGTYTIGANCMGTGTPEGGNPFSIVVTPSGFLALHLDSEGFAVQQGSPACTNAGVVGNFALETTGTFLSTGAVSFVGELKLTVNPSGDGAISGDVASSEDGTFQTEPVTGSYAVAPDCRGWATLKPKGLPEMRFHLVLVDDGKEMLAIETDAETIVSGTLVKGN